MSLPPTLSAGCPAVAKAFALALSVLGAAMAPGAKQPFAHAARSCPACEEAEALLAAGDTAAAIRRLRAAADSSPASSEAAAGLGLMLARTAQASARDRAVRVEAERRLERAVRQDPADPRWLLGLGVLRFKQGANSEAARFLDGALSLVNDGRHRPSGLLAELYAVQGSLLEQHALDFEDLANWPGSTVDPNDCGQGAPCWLDTVDRSFGPAGMDSGGPASSTRAREEMRRRFAAAFDMSPALGLAARGLLAEAARLNDWPGFVHLAERHLRAAGPGGWPAAFLAAGYWRLGEVSRADSLFDLALATMPPSERAVLENVAPSVLPEHEERYLSGDPNTRAAWSRFLLRTSDPLFLTPVNERRLEHFTRIVIAELWFGDPRGAFRGTESDQGIILIRYGEPDFINQIAPGDGSPQEQPTQQSKTLVDLHAMGDAVLSTGRTLFWSYGHERVNFVFWRMLGQRAARHTPSSGENAHRFRSIQPSALDFRVDRLPHQLVRFRGEQDEVEVDLYALLPADPDGRWDVPGRAGVFFLPRTPAEDIGRLERNIEVGDAPRILTFRISTEPGTYHYSVEAMSDDDRLRARQRGRFEATVFPPGDLSMSDLLVARSVAPKGDAEPRERRDFTIVPAADLCFEPGEQVSVYLELYDLAAGSDGAARFRFELGIVDAAGRGVVARAIRALGNVLRSPGRTALTWERTVPEVESARTPEWFSLDLGEIEPGRKRIDLKVTDLVSRREVTTHRIFAVAGPTGCDAVPATPRREDVSN